ncbi:hypothetical protein BU23DRAFT_49472 [Bimuria novae-zelandiae CBS 107.79]|uniref:Uncharacterized protein n=1 Tax=Bimuria novae-zelandiae CBS 107.79 TaxID=1447943 RepID=A0A6A5UM45_9PLEO|nr:hypothetical protein BU23DRAFT_49472 [Bimuria novae-zelandiae CBS 107.79]
MNLPQKWRCSTLEQHCYYKETIVLPLKCSQLHDPEEVSIKKILQWALKKVSETSLNLQYHIDHPASRSPEQNASQQNASQPDTTVNMRRGHTFPDLRDEHSPPTRPYMPSYHSFTSLTNSANAADPGRNNPYSSEMPPTTNSPHHTASSSGSVFMGPHSPLQAPQPTRPTMLPSPSSMHFSSVSTLAPISPPVPAATQAAAQSTFLQDLQHQISVKTIAHQSLQREYENLLQKLDRQRTKCATLEKKFEVSDVEINNLTDEKEMLLAQVAAMERQVEELQESRDESRRQLVANGAQYMRIMEMANRLQAQSAEDKKRWDAEKAELQQRIRVLEEAMVTGTDSDHPDRSPPPSIIFAYSSGSRASPSTETINVLRGEIGRLRIRTQTLEKALQTTKEEGMSIQEAAKTLMNSGGKIEQATRGALE